MDTSGRVPPHSVEAERAVLGSIILDNRAISRVRGIMLEEDFYYESHRRIYRSMIALKAKGEPIDPVTLGTNLLDSGELERVGGALALNDLLDGVATVANIEHYAKQISNKAIIRRMMYAAQEIVAAGYAGQVDFDEFINSSRSSIVRAAAGAVDISSGARKIDEDLKEAWKQITENNEPDGLIKTGIAAIDRTTGGLFPGLLTVLAARPAMGKSCVGLNIGINVAKQRKKVMLITMEDTRYFVVLRLLARFSDIDLQKLTLRTVIPNDYPRVLQGVTGLSSLPFWVDDTSSLSIDQIKTRVAMHHEEHGLDLLVIDHLLEIDAEAENETQKVSKAAAGARDIAKDLGIPVLLLHQLNRGVESRSDKRPMLSDLKQAGKVEEVCRQAWFLYRPGYYTAEEEERRDLQLIVAKSNHGKTGTVKLWGRSFAHVYPRMG